MDYGAEKMKAIQVKNIPFMKRHQRLTGNSDNALRVDGDGYRCR